MSAMGRPSKGDRVATYFRPHREVRAALEQSWRDQGFDSLSDYVAALAARDVGLEHLAPHPAGAEGQRRLPVSPAEEGFSRAG